MLITKKRPVILAFMFLTIIVVAAVNRQKQRMMKWFDPPLVVAATAAPVAKPLALRAFASLRGVHYFGDTYPKQFWNSFEPSDVVRDFKQIRADGFNSIVLVVPWAEFQPSIDNRKHDERMFERLRYLLDTAHQTQLGVVLRVSYFWTYRPDAELNASRRFSQLFYNDEVRDTWLDHLSEIYSRVGSHPAFRLAFLCWEDLHLMELPGAAEELGEEGLLKLYRNFLSRTSQLGEISKLYGKTFTSWDQISFPGRKSPAYAKVFDYWDDALLNRLFIPANARFPNLSFEVRSDWDPIWETENKIVWKNHATTYVLPGTNTRTSYYATSWGMKNQGDFVTAEEALSGFDRYFDHVQGGDVSRHLFIDQFLFYYRLPSHRLNTQVKPEERGKFLEGVSTRMREKDISYSLWYYRDYVDNVIYNSQFSLGLDGWSGSSAVKTTSLPSGRYAVEIPRGGSISQHIPANLRNGWNVFSAPRDICLVRANNLAVPAEIRITTQFGKALLQWKTGVARACTKIQVGTSFELAIHSDREVVVLDEVKLYALLEPSAVYGVDGQKGPQLDSIRRLNSLIAGELGRAK